MAGVLKIKCRGEVYRGVLEGPEVAYENVVEVLEKASKLHGESIAYKAKYLDEEGDLCVLCAATFTDFLATACSEINGRKVYKLELFLDGGAAGAARPTKDCKANHHGHQEHACLQEKLEKKLWWLHPRKFVWLLSRLRASGVLKSEVVAAMVAHALPEILSGSQKDIISFINDNLSDEKKHRIINALKVLFVNKAEFEKCDNKFAQFINGEITAGEAIVELLHTLQTLNFDSRVLFLMEVFKSQEEKLHKMLDEVDKHTPDVFKTIVEHKRITCDGCNTPAIKGPRFKCMSHPDYDLCGMCYAKRTTVYDHDEQKADHSFEMLVLDYHSEEFKGLMAARKAMKTKSGQDCKPGKACEAGCGYATTWHPTHCCNACRVSGGHAHGPRCQKVMFKKEAAKADDASTKSHEGSERTEQDEQVQQGEKEENITSASNDEKSNKDPKDKEAREAVPEPSATPVFKGPEPEGSEKTGFDLSFPVAVEDGRQLVINWNLGDQPADVAKEFALQHGIPLEEVSTIIDFIHHVYESLSKIEEPKAEEPKAEEPKTEEPEAKEPRTEEPKAVSMEDKLRKRFEIVEPQSTEEQPPLGIEMVKLQEDAEQAEKPSEKQIDTDNTFVDTGVQHLLDMGFGQHCSPENLKLLLVDCGGDVEKVVQHLLIQQ